GNVAVNAYLIGIGFDMERQRQWKTDFDKNPKIRLQHYTTDAGRRGITRTGVIDPAFTKEGKNFFSPNIYGTSDDATEYLALPSRAEYYISLNMSFVADKLSPLSVAEPKNGHDGGGLETFTTLPVSIKGAARAPSPWSPLSD